jgi:hypothetical protein
LQHVRGIGFADVITCIQKGGRLATIKHPHPEKYPNQNMYIVHCKKYVYSVPFIEDEERIFLKTIIPSRKLKKKYLKHTK